MTTLSNITISNTTFSAGGGTRPESPDFSIDSGPWSGGLFVATITVVVSTGTFTGVLSVSGASASSFQVVGNTLETVGYVAPGTYNINIVATQVGAIGSPLTVPFVLMGSSGPNVANALFFEDFNTLDISWSGQTTTTPHATPGFGSVVLAGHTYTVTTVATGAIPQEDGGQMANGSQVAALYNVAGVIWVVNIQNQWFSWNGTSFAAGSEPAITFTTTWIDHYPFGGNEYFLPFVDEQEYACSIGPGNVSSTGYQPYSVANSILSIQAESVTTSGISNPAGQPWNSGIMSSCWEVSGAPANGLFQFQYGYVEGRMWIPAGGPTNLNGPGCWSLLVLYPISGDGNMEIDIIEGLGGSPTIARQTIHGGGAATVLSLSPVVAIDTGFHTVGVDWQATTITFYVDGIATGSVAVPTGGTNHFNQPCFINVGLAIAGSTSWGGGTPVNTLLVDPAVLHVDYIGVWPNFASAYPS